MLFIRCLTSFLIFALVCVPAIIVSIPVVALLLLTSWDGRSTIFGNAKWGRANTHPSFPTKGWWQEFNWLVLRNPVNNLMTKTLAYDWGDQLRSLVGEEGIGDKTYGGFYVCTVNRFWEYYYVKPYGRRCIRIRIGWKIFNSDRPAAFVFAINPWKKYSGE